MSARAAALGRAEGPARAGRGRAPAVYGWAATAVGILAVFLTLGLIVDAFDPAPSGPPSSSYATTPRGTAAWAELLERSGHPVIQLRQPLGGATLDPGTTLVVLGAGSLTGSAARHLDAFVRAGGRLLIDASSPRRVLPALISDPPSWSGTSARAFHPLRTAPETRGVSTVESAGGGAWLAGPGQRVLANRAGGSLLLIRTLGHGRIELLADPSPVQNRLLGSADNAQLALDLAGAAGRPVVFAEALHGFGEATGVGALPETFWVVFVGLCLAAAAWALARGKRLGPAEPPAVIGQPPRSAYAGALAGALTRAKDPAALSRLARARIGEELARRLARRAGGAESPQRETLAALGLSERERDLVLAPEGSGEEEADLLVLGGTLARLRSER